MCVYIYYHIYLWIHSFKNLSGIYNMPHTIWGIQRSKQDAVLNSCSLYYSKKKATIKRWAEWFSVVITTSVKQKERLARDGGDKLTPCRDLVGGHEKAEAINPAYTRTAERQSVSKTTSVVMVRRWKKMAISYSKSERNQRLSFLTLIIDHLQRKLSWDSLFCSHCIFYDLLHLLEREASHATIHAQRSDDNLQELVLASHHDGSRNWSQIIKLGGGVLPLNPLSSP